MLLCPNTRDSTSLAHSSQMFIHRILSIDTNVHCGPCAFSLWQLKSAWFLREIIDIASIYASWASASENQAKHGAILPCFCTPAHQQLLEGWHFPAFHSNDSFGFKHKPTMSISILCSVTVGSMQGNMLPPHTFLAYTPYPSLAAPTVLATEGNMISSHRGHP